MAAKATEPKVRKLTTQTNDLLDNSRDSLKKSVIDHLEFSLGKDEYSATRLDKLKALAMATRDRMIERWLVTQRTYHKKDVKRIYYLSLEFLIGRTLGNALLNLGLHDEVELALKDLGFSLADLEEAEVDAGLGNGGLGRLAACFLDSMATLQLPAYGYGIRYEYGIFYQKIKDGHQAEQPDNWLRYGNPWEFEHPEDLYPVHFYGKVETTHEANGNISYKWVDTEEIVAIAYDMLIPGYGNNTVNNLRLWSAKSSREFLFDEFNAGDYEKAVAHKNNSEVISKVLYPNDQRYTGKELRLKQQYFFVCATIQDAIRRYRTDHPGDNFKNFTKKVFFQLNDTHPSIAIAELMRVLMDENHLNWEDSWAITTNCFGYTNHTVLPEALEKWPVNLIEHVLPRHMQIIYEINRRFMEFVKANYPTDVYRMRRMSIIEEAQEKMVRMSNLAIVGSCKVNGVAALHSKILINEVFRDFYELWPEKFNNKTNGITFRRFLLHCNPELTKLIDKQIGTDWHQDLTLMKELAKSSKDDAFQKAWLKNKKQAKVKFAGFLMERFGFEVDPDSMFDFQVKRIHEYKRQLMNLMHVITLYNRIKKNPAIKIVPRTVFFGGKAAPGYFMAKLIIKLINSVADVVNNDKDVAGRLRVYFLPNYSVSLMEKILPASELSEQISTAGMEASGTGNMKFALNGALTIGTLDGANIEIMEEVGKKNIFIFGHTDAEIAEIKKVGYNPMSYYQSNAELRAAVDAIAHGVFSPEQPDLFMPVVSYLMYEGDRFFLMADYEDYIRCQDAVSKAYTNPAKWAEMSINNVAHISKFSSDRTIREYADDIWGVKSTQIDLK